MLASGFHAVALQSYGWARMYDVYSDSLPAAQALDLTFSGLDLCGICILSQETLQDIDDSLSLALAEKSPLTPLPFSYLSYPKPEEQPITHGPPPLRIYQEITLSFEPPPPRCA
ncbi:hypothetical protein VDG1235_897 [Verrucomicrobiia bacterium DG1235]|nr:hypothetical protein VDG1235_897 [Verrucomicrobiae bacterium DG1235]